MKKILKKIIKALSFINILFLKKNVNKTKYKKKVLISYITTPFEKSKKTLHTNSNEVLLISYIYSKLGYNVDIIDYDINCNLNFYKYDLIFGFGMTFEQSFQDSRFRGKRIYYATGAHVMWQNHAEINRIADFNYKNNCKLLPKRLVPWTWSLSTSFSDAMIVIGNTWTKSTYLSFFNKEIYSINATGSFEKFPSFPIRNINLVRNSLLWFGSNGLIHKGLDICIDFIEKNQKYDLHICGPKENDFFEVYNEKILSKNIHYHGFVDTHSDLFIEIVNKCMFSIMPSCSEGQSTALLTTMGTGLIPIGTIQTGVDLDNIGFVLESIDHASISAVFDRVNGLSETQINDLSFKIYNYTHKYHSKRAYQDSFEYIIKTILRDV